MNICVCGLSEANNLKNNFTYCLSIADNNSDYHVENFNGKILRIQFRDYEFLDEKSKNRLQKQVNKFNEFVPTYKHIEQIADFFKDFIKNKKDEDKILIHCHAGISRSTACSLLLFLMMGNDIKKSIEMLDNIRSIASPNKLMVKYIDDYMNLNGELEEAVWKRELNLLK